MPFSRRRIHFQLALDAIHPRGQVGQNLPDRFHIAVRRVHEESYALSAKPVTLARYFCLTLMDLAPLDIAPLDPGFLDIGLLDLFERARLSAAPISSE